MPDEDFKQTEGGPRPAEGPPPFGGSWRTLYAVVILNLVLLVALFALFTRYFR
jgi:hypothetical protein